MRDSGVNSRSFDSIAAGSFLDSITVQLCVLLGCEESKQCCGDVNNVGEIVQALLVQCCRRLSCYFMPLIRYECHQVAYQKRRCPSWSKGLHSSCSVFVLVGSNPTRRNHVLLIISILKLLFMSFKNAFHKEVPCSPVRYLWLYHIILYNNRKALLLFEPQLAVLFIN